ncbi:MAG: ExbD/TolR family protein [Gemmataceae bacterium]
MSTWKVRHEGSPQAVEGLSLQEIVDGLQEGQWETTDEVIGPDDEDWHALENHPALAEVVADLEEPPPRFEEDETRLDMNPLIDVALVLLIFFIITASYAALQRVLQMPSSKQAADGPTVVSKERVQQYTLQLELRKQGEDTIIRLEGKPVGLEELSTVLAQRVAATQRNELVLDVEGVDWGTVVKVQDIAKGAGIERIHYLVKPVRMP